MREVRNIKKLSILILLFLGAFTGTLLYNYNHKIIAKPENSVVDTKINEIQSEIDKYKEKEQEEKLRKLKLQQLQNPEIIHSELTKVGKLIIYQGKTTYEDIIKESKWYGKKELHIELKYNFGIGIDLNKIIVDRFFEDTVVIKIPRKEIKVEYIELNAQDSKINGEKSFLASQFKPSDIRIILDEAQNSTKNKIDISTDIFDMATESLKETLRELVIKLGYKDTIFTDM